MSIIHQSLLVKVLSVCSYIQISIIRCHYLKYLMELIEEVKRIRIEDLEPLVVEHERCECGDPSCEDEQGCSDGSDDEGVQIDERLLQLINGGVAPDGSTLTVMDGRSGTTSGSTTVIGDNGNHSGSEKKGFNVHDANPHDVNRALTTLLQNPEQAMSMVQEGIASMPEGTLDQVRQQAKSGGGQTAKLRQIIANKHNAAKLPDRKTAKKMQDEMRSKDAAMKKEKIAAAMSDGLIFDAVVFNLSNKLKTKMLSRQQYIQEIGQKHKEVRISSATVVGRRVQIVDVPGMKKNKRASKLFGMTLTGDVTVVPDEGSITVKNVEDWEKTVGK